MKGDAKEKGKPFKKASLKVSDLRIRQGKIKESNAKLIQKQFLRITGLTMKECDGMSRDGLFKLGLYHITTTHKGICDALRIPISNTCRTKRDLEKAGRLVSSIDEVPCPITGAKAHLLTTNPKMFTKLRRSDQLCLELKTEPDE